MNLKLEIIESAYRGILPDEQVDKMVAEAIRKADNRVKFFELYSENDIERGLEIDRINKELHKNQHGE